MPQGDEVPAQILIKLGEMGAQLAVISTQLQAIPDHEQRLRALERARWPLPAVSALCAVVAVIATVVEYARH
jgi:hypothetical protein